MNKEKYYFNKNWLFSEKKKGVFLYNLVLSRELYIENDNNPNLDLLKFLQRITSFDIRSVANLFKREFPDADKKWISVSIEQLRKYGIIKKERRDLSLSSNYLIGLDRQIGFFEDLFPDKNKYAVQEKLRDTKVAILGLGSVAQHIIESFVAVGIGNYVCVDFDVVEERNIGRQPIFRRSDIGKRKTSVVKRYIEEGCLGSQVKVFNKMIRDKEDVKVMIEGCDIVLHCCDYPRFIIHQWISQACLEVNKPNLLVHAGRVGPFCVPQKTSCFGCLEVFYEKHFSIYKDIKKTIIEEGFGRYPTLAITPALTGTIAAKEVFNYILNMEYDTQNAFIDIEPRTLKIIRHKLQRQSKCPICGNKDGKKK